MDKIYYFAAYIILLVLTCIIIVYFTVLDKGFLSVLKTSRRSILYYSLGLYIFLVLFVVVISWSEIRISALFARSFTLMQKDFTHIFAQWEKNTIIQFQHVQGYVLTLLFGYMYIIVWPSLVVSSLIIYAYHEDLKTIRSLAKGYLFSYLSVVPFYFLFPIKETWVSEVGMQFMLNDITPKLEQCLRPLSGIDNCFPSFHVLLSFTVSFTALIKGYYRLGMTLIILSVLISLSTLYLGIHWISDVVAGVVFAGLVSLLISFTERSKSKLKIQEGLHVN